MWRAVVSSYDAFGKRHQKVSAWFDRKADAQEAEAVLKANQAKEKMAKTFGEVCAEWIEYTKKDNVAKTYPAARIPSACAASSTDALEEGKAITASSIPNFFK